MKRLRDEVHVARADPTDSLLTWCWSLVRVPLITIRIALDHNDISSVIAYQLIHLWFVRSVRISIGDTFTEFTFNLALGHAELLRVVNCTSWYHEYQVWAYRPDPTRPWLPNHLIGDLSKLSSMKECIVVLQMGYTHVFVDVTE